jgi:undecaprenyl-diphosphatase
MNLLEAVVLGLVQGAAEFLPISSSGHLVLVPWWLGWEEPPLVYDVTVHLGTTLAVLAYFWRDWLALARAGWQLLREGAITTHEQYLLLFLILSTLPGIVAGLLIKDVFESVFSEPSLVALMLVVTAGLLSLSEYLSQHRATQARPLEAITLRDAVGIGLAQALAVIPGISRSGSTMAAGLSLGLSREAAARYSFLMSTPIIIGAGLVQGLDIVRGEVALEGDMAGALLVGFISSALMGYLSIAFLLNFVRGRSFYGFAAYCAALGIISFIAIQVSG